MLIALPNPDGSFTCTLFFPFEGSPSFAELRTEADVERFFAEEFPRRARTHAPADRGSSLPIRRARW
jgi:kynurenine 3-monooxygenase